jgi:cysteine desulfurase
MKPNYFDNCKTTQPYPEVIEAMLPYFVDKFQYPENFIEAGSRAEEEIGNFKQIVARSIGGKSDEIHFTTGGTSANNLAIKGYLMKHSSKGRHIICSVADYPDILTNAAFFENSGFDVTYLSVDSDGFIDLEELKRSIRNDTILFMTTYVNHTVGTIQPLKKIRAILDEADDQIAMFVDAGQAYGKLPINVTELGIDLMSVSAHKIHGPQGIGVLYQRKGISIAPTKHGIARVDNLETGGLSIALIAGFAKAVELTFASFEKDTKHLRSLSDYCLKTIEERIPHIIVNGPRGKWRAPHNMNISFKFIEGEAILLMLDLQGITAATGSACASQGLRPNYILMAMGRTHEESHGSMKFTFSKFNTIEEIDKAVDKLAEIVAELRSRSPLYKNRERL